MLNPIALCICKNESPYTRIDTLIKQATNLKLKCTNRTIYVKVIKTTFDNFIPHNSNYATGEDLYQIISNTIRPYYTTTIKNPSQLRQIDCKVIYDYRVTYEIPYKMFKQLHISHHDQVLIILQKNLANDQISLLKCFIRVKTWCTSCGQYCDNQLICSQCISKYCKKFMIMGPTIFFLLNESGYLLFPVWQDISKYLTIIYNKIYQKLQNQMYTLILYPFLVV